MVGNDIVDLHDPESQPESLHPRFDTRVFNARERVAVAEAGSPAEANRVRWRMWAAKEAAYKLVRKLSPKTVFSPIRFSVDLDCALPGALHEGRVEYAGLSLPVRAEESSAWVHVIASEPASEGRCEGKPELIARIAEVPGAALASGDPGAPGRAVRQLVCEALAGPLGLRPSELEVRSVERVPHLFLSGTGEPAAADLSLSHHGRFVAFACALDSLPTIHPGRSRSLGARL